MRIVVFLLLISIAQRSVAQEHAARSRDFPVTVTLFCHAAGLPGLRSLFQSPRFGIRVGTEFYYRQSNGEATVQTVNIGYYRHRNFQDGLFISSEFGYRRFSGNTFGDATAGIGMLIVNAALPRYERHDAGYRRSPQLFARVMPTLGIGGGYQFQTTAVFTRYEVFGEMPFGFKGLPALPHHALHIGTRVQTKHQ